MEALRYGGGARLAALLALVALAPGCVPGSRPDDPQLAKVLACSGGVIASYRAGLDIGTELRTRIAAGASANDAVHGYIFELLPSEHRLKGFEDYLECMKQPSDAMEIHPRLFPVVERSNQLYNDFTEAERKEKTLPFGDADRYAQLGASFRTLSEDGFNARSRIRRSDRQALMYFLAAEVILRSPQPAAGLAVRARDYSADAYDAARHTRELYEALIAKGGSGPEADWLASAPVRETVLNRLADVQAQRAYTSGDRRYLDELDDTLGLLSCDYIRDFRTRDDPMYKRIPAPRRFRECGLT